MARVSLAWGMFSQWLLNVVMRLVGQVKWADTFLPLPPLLRVIELSCKPPSVWIFQVHDAHYVWWRIGAFMSIQGVFQSSGTNRSEPWCLPPLILTRAMC